MFSARHLLTASPDELAALEATRVAVTSEMRTAQKTSQVAAKKGSLTLKGVFMGIQVGKASAKNTAAAGQGGADKKDPPTRINVLVLLEEVTSKKVAGAEYAIISPTQIELPSRDSKQQTNAKKLYVGASAELVKAETDKAPEDVIAQRKLAVDRAKQAMNDADTIVTHMTLTNGQTYTVATFDHVAAKALRPFQTVLLVGVTSSCSKNPTDNKLYVNLDCASPVVQDGEYGAYPMLSKVIDLHQIPLRPYEPDSKEGRTQIVYFGHYSRDARDIAEKRGPVARKYFGNSINRADYKIVPQKGDPTLTATWCMNQHQDVDTPGAPAGHYTILAKIFEAKDWEPANQQVKNSLRVGFGINDPDRFAAVMAANSVPCIASCSYNLKAAPGNNTIHTYGNEVSFLLREYLLYECPQVSLDYVKATFGIDPGNPFIFMDNENPQRPCQLNAASLCQRKGKSALKRTGVILLNEFKGDLTNLMKTALSPCEFRVLHSSSPSDMVTRGKIALLPPAEAERVLAGDPKAAFRLETVPDVKMVYMVCTMDDDERKAYEDAENAWLERRNAHLTVPQAGDDDHEHHQAPGTKRERSEADHETVATDAQKKQHVDPDQEDEGDNKYEPHDAAIQDDQEDLLAGLDEEDFE